MCIDGIPSRGLFSGSVYEQLAYHACCGISPFPLISVDRSTGRTLPCVCKRCQTRAPDAPNGWYNARRFIPFNPDVEKLGDLVDEIIPEPLVEEILSK